MFLPTLKSQTTDEQKKLFLEPALRHEIIGCYAQTEVIIYITFTVKVFLKKGIIVLRAQLGHGSNVQGLETTATYIPETKEFEIHSPTLTSSKWWIGGLGKAANHAIVMARLITDGKDLGPHPFCVQIRSLQDHTPLPGITVGDIGPKFGFNATDNGFIMFDHYRVPHLAFLAKYSQVKKSTGEYSKPPNAKLSYGTMVYVRANIVMGKIKRYTGTSTSDKLIVFTYTGVRYALAKATTIAIRYSTIRQQFVDATSPKKWDNKVIETPVLDYTMQQYRLLPIIASAYACFFTGREMLHLYDLNQESMQNGNFGLLADLHASSSGLKSLTTTMAVESLEDCRRACGGHGYSLFSGLGQFYQDYVPNVTWEGDNYILTQQTARYLLKTFRNVCCRQGWTL
jgi:acyl-CoA oxidase